jgi:hypothetical protein
MKMRGNGALKHETVRPSTTQSICILVSKQRQLPGFDWQVRLLERFPSAWQEDITAGPFSFGFDHMFAGDEFFGSGTVLFRRPLIPSLSRSRPWDRAAPALADTAPPQIR